MVSGTSAEILAKARRVKLVLTDCDGVLTDAGVYYSEHGELLKKFSIRDGMGVERLRKLVNIETGIVTGERSLSVQRRAEKLQITECHLGVQDKAATLRAIVERRALAFEAVAYIGDDVNDLDIFSMVGFTACPSDGLPQVKQMAHFVCRLKGGEGAFREFAELIIAAHMGVGR